MSYLLQALHHSYPGRAGTVESLRGIDLRIAQGEQVAILGPSGAGKTSLLRLCNATLRPTRGRLSFDGRDLASLKRRELRAVRRRIGTISQHPSLVPSLSVMQNALCGRLGSWGLLRSLRALVAPSAADLGGARQALRSVDLEAKAQARADELSGGQQQRVAIARVLVQEPEVVLADEPFASLDPGLTGQLSELLFEAARGRTFIAALHDVQLALRLFPRIVGLRAGRIQFDRAAADVTPEMVADLYALRAAG